MELPIAFAERMAALLGNEYNAFCDALCNEESVKGLRVNTHKVYVCEFEKNSPFSLEKIPYVEGGFIVPDSEGAGKHPYHHAGAYYMQDPGAMSAVAALPEEIWEQGGLKILDLCAAPGGKTTQLAAKCAKNGGVVLSNEYPTAQEAFEAMRRCMPDCRKFDDGDDLKDWQAIIDNGEGDGVFIQHCAQIDEEHNLLARLWPVLNQEDK
jgi:16S rRNA C967 or C1407 C5-methylase (RsmB/RsmF family)